MEEAIIKTEAVRRNIGNNPQKFPGRDWMTSSVEAGDVFLRTAVVAYVYNMAVVFENQSQKNKIILSAITSAVNLFIENEQESESENLQLTNLMLNILMEKNSKRKRLYKVQSYYESVIPRYSDRQFQAHFRLTRSAFQHLINNLSFLRKSDVIRGKKPLHFQKMIMIFIWTMANQESFRGIADRFNVSKSTASAAFITVTKAIKKITPYYIKWPEQNEMQEIISDFQNIKGFPGVIGAVDGTHIAIKAPKHSSDSYINRKGFHSIILQTVCNAQMKFIHCYAGEVGSVHDARVLRKSPLHSILRNPLNFPNYSHLIGDAAYPCMSTLLTPFRDNGHLTVNQKLYNEKISATRCVIERAFALLKGIFRRLKYLEMSKTDLIPMVIIACCTLHNLCLEYNDINNDDLGNFNFSENLNCNTDYCNSIEESGAEKRGYIASLLS